MAGQVAVAIWATWINLSLTMHAETKVNPFGIDVLRQDLARKGDVAALRATYEPGSYPELSDMSSAELWDDLAAYPEVPEFRIRRLQAVADRIPPGSKVLDIGIGWGEIVPMVLARGNCRYTGIDFSERIVEEAAKKQPACRFLVGGIEQIAETFDVILALEVCEHILPSKIFGFFRQIGKLLEEHGQLIVTVPVYENLRAVTLRCPNCGHMHNRMGHVRSYTPELIKAELGLAGFDVAESFFIYANFDNSLAGRIKRHIVNIGLRAFRLGQTNPLNIVVVARKTRRAR
jgi:2-polyprenyl-3-methyl-5-hydroxy-6-metoxy-1,4-benzoquinol methylase